MTEQVTRDQLYAQLIKMGGEIVEVRTIQKQLGVQLAALAAELEKFRKRTDRFNSLVTAILLVGFVTLLYLLVTGRI